MYPFGSGAPYAPPNNSSSMYPQNMPFGAGFQAPPNQTPYPPQHQNTTPYPAQGPSYGAPYPPSQGSSPYPAQGSYGAPYPPSQGFQQGGYPPSIPQQQCPYPPSSANAAPYQQSSPYPQQSHGSHYAAHHQPSGGYPANNNMASCFSEMKTNMYGGVKSSPRSKGTPTITPSSNFDPVKDAHDLRKAMKGFGTDEDSLINIICRRTNEERLEIQRQYKTNFGKDLIEDIKSETSGNFERLLVALLRPIVDFYVTELNAAMAGIGTDEDVLVEILCTLSNAEVHTIKNAYLRCYGAHLESELKSETSGNFKRLLVSLCTANRDESGRTDVQAAQNDARELLKAGELRVGTDESTFNMILCQRNYQQLKLIFSEYEKMTGHSLEKAIKKEFSGDIMDGLLAIYKCVTNKAEYFASRLHKSMAGIGTNDSQLIRVIVSRCEVDLQDIKTAFERLYGKSLKSWIKGDTSGHYKHALYALIGEQRSS